MTGCNISFFFVFFYCVFICKTLALKVGVVVMSHGYSGQWISFKLGWYVDILTSVWLFWITEHRKPSEPHPEGNVEY